MSLPDLRICVDLETTGLAHNSHLLEIGMCLFDIQAPTQILDTFAIQIKDPVQLNVKALCIPLVQEMHSKSGLFEERLKSGIDYASAELLMKDQLTTWRETEKVADFGPMVGSSVHNDRAWLENWFGQDFVDQFWSYRNIDVSTLKELCKVWNPDIYDKLDKQVKPKKIHRVISDCQDTLAELKFYMDNFLFTLEEDINYV